MENQVRIEVRNAQFGVQQNRASVDSAQAAVDLARQSLDAGTEEIRARRIHLNSGAAEPGRHDSSGGHARLRQGFIRKGGSRTGPGDRLLLDHAGILIADAERGQVTQMPNIPHVAPRPAEQQAPATDPPNAAATVAENSKLERRASMPGVSLLHRSQLSRILSGETLSHRRGQCRDGRPRPSKPSKARQALRQRQEPRVILSVVIITHNEEANIARTLASVQPLVADGKGEIIVVDSGSTDRTVEIAKSFGAKVFIEDWKGYAAQKNSAIDKATGDWILSLDADEEVEPKLAADIQATLAKCSEVD